MSKEQDTFAAGLELRRHMFGVAGAGPADRSGDGFHPSAAGHGYALLLRRRSGSVRAAG